jgi:hypothetical protein
VVGRTAPQTRSDAARLQILSDLYCIPCAIDNWAEPAEIRHITEGFRRVNGSETEHRWTYCICPWHHRSVPPTEIYYDFGPSMARDPRAYHARYGSERELVQIADALVRIVQAAQKRHEWLPDIKLIAITQALHREIVLKKPHNPETLRRYCG